MQLLVPIDSSESSLKALQLGIEFANRFDGDLDVIHITDFRTDATEDVVDRANDVLATEGIDSTVEVLTSSALDNRGVSSEIGEYIIDIIEERGYDHVVMGRHESGKFEEMLLGSTSKKVVGEAPVPVTVTN